MLLFFYGCEIDEIQSRAQRAAVNRAGPLAAALQMQDLPLQEPLPATLSSAPTPQMKLQHGIAPPAANRIHLAHTVPESRLRIHAVFYRPSAFEKVMSRMANDDPTNADRSIGCSAAKVSRSRLSPPLATYGQT
jgi:hypothetical protein